MIQCLHPCIFTGVPSTIEHFYYECAASVDRLLVMMALLRLGLVRKKTLTFVNTVDQVEVASCCESR